MAYVCDEKEKLEIDYPLEKLWEAIPKVAAALEWIIEEKDEINHKAKLKTKSGFMSYGSTISVEVKSVNEKTSRMYINAETPVTTITSMADFGRTRDRIEAFLMMLAKQLENKKQ